MSNFLDDLEYYSSIHKCYTYGKIIGIEDENSYIIKNLKDGNEEFCDSHDIRKVTFIKQTSFENGKWEYIKDEDEFLDVNIKEKKGLFYIIEFTDENDNSSTKLARQKELRYINYITFDELIDNKYFNIILEIPPELSSWIDSEKYKETMKQLENKISDCENPILYSVSYQNSENETYSLRIFCNIEKKDFVKLYLESSIDGEKKLASLNKDKENSKKELEDVKRKNKTILIPKKFVGLIIGRDGINIKNLKKKYGVNIQIDSKKVDEKNISKVIITGENGEKVEQCSKEIDVIQKIYEVSEKCSNDIRKRKNDLIEKYKLKMITISNEEKKGDEDKIYKAPNVECIGNEEYIEEFYNNEIKNFENYSYENNYNNYSSGSSYKPNNKRNNNYYGYQNNYNSNKNYYPYYSNKKYYY